MPLEDYQSMRDFTKTREPAGTAELAQSARAASNAPIFVIQEHHASHLHYDFRLEADGVLKSWAVPKKPTLDPTQKRLAVQVEDHPLDYASFEGTIPKGQYGGGTVAIWDRGTYESPSSEENSSQSVAEAIEAGHLEFVLHGQKLEGGFALIRMKPRGKGKPQWLLIKKKDAFAQADPSSTRPEQAGDVGSAAHSKQKATGSGDGQTSPRRHSTRRGRAANDGSHEVVLTHPERLMFPEASLSKRDVDEYYERIADRLLPFLKDRPVTLERLPDGLSESRPHFWQKNTPDYYPDWIPRVTLETERGTSVDYTLVNDVDALRYLVNQGTVTFHVWASRVPDLDRPDFVLFDLDPGKAPFLDLVDVAKRLHEALDSTGCESFLKTSGKTGLHVLTPWLSPGGYDEARAWAADMAARVAERLPDVATTEIRKSARKGRVYIDVMQNARGHHAVPPFVIRAVPQASVSTPLSWKELTASLDPGQFTTRTIFRRLARQRLDPMAGLLKHLGTARI